MNTFNSLALLHFLVRSKAFHTRLFTTHSIIPRTRLKDKCAFTVNTCPSSVSQSKQSQIENGRLINDTLFDYDRMEDITGNSMPLYDDPFATSEEMIATCDKKRQAKSGKERWANAVSHIKPGFVLVANEKLTGTFHQTVVLVIDHDDAVGSTGVIINRPYPGDLSKMPNDIPSNIEANAKSTFNEAPVAFGGLTVPTKFLILHGYGAVDGSKELAPGVFIGGLEELRKQVQKTRFDPTNALLLKGQTSWIPGQLSIEAFRGVWTVANVSADFILRYVGAPVEGGDQCTDLWSDILTCLGGEYAIVAKEHANNRGDMRMGWYD